MTGGGVHSDTLNNVNPKWQVGCCCRRRSSSHRHRHRLLPLLLLLVWWLGISGPNGCQQAGRAELMRQREHVQQREMPATLMPG